MFQNSTLLIKYYCILRKMYKHIQNMTFLNLKMPFSFPTWPQPNSVDIISSVLPSHPYCITRGQLPDRYKQGVN